MKFMRLLVTGIAIVLPFTHLATVPSQTYALTVSSFTFQSEPLQITHIASATSLKNVLIKQQNTSKGMENWYSTDGGVNWTQFLAPGYQSSLEDEAVLIVRRTDNNQPARFVQNGQLGVFWRSGDLGNSWASYTFPLLPKCTSAPEAYGIVWDITISPADPQRLYASYWCDEYIVSPFISTQVSQYYESALYTSADAGLSWQKVHTVTRELTTSPTLSNRVMVLWKSAPLASIWLKSDDAGKTWITQTLPHNNEVDLLTFDFQDPEILYTRANSFYSDGDPVPNGFTGYRSEDDGKSWVSWSTPCPGDGGPSVDLVANPLKTKMLFLNCSSLGLWRSKDGGDSWHQLSPLSGTVLTVDLGNPGRLLWGRSDGLWQSCDEGGSWSLITSVCKAFGFKLFVPTIAR